jgi:hypothetical protein
VSLWAVRMKSLAWACIWNLEITSFCGSYSVIYWFGSEWEGLAGR